VSGFDPYQVWLDIGPEQRPVDHYRLLGLPRTVQDPAMIVAAADRVATHLAQFANAGYPTEHQRLLAEVQTARDCLSNPATRQAYDARQAAMPPTGPAPAGGGEQRLTSAPAVPTGPADATVPPPAPATPMQPSQPAPASPTSLDRQIHGAPPVPTATPHQPVAQQTAGQAGHVSTTGTQPQMPGPQDVPIQRPAPAPGPAQPTTPNPATMGAAAQPQGTMPPQSPQMRQPMAGYPQQGGYPTSMGQPVGGYAPAPAYPAQQAPAPTQPPQTGSDPMAPTAGGAKWVPKRRGGKVGKSITAAEGGQIPNPMDKTAIAKDRRPQKRKSTKSNQVVIVLLCCLGLLVGLGLALMVASM
jgi:hypothetical protein